MLVHYYQFNIADYRKDTTHLTPIEHYIYRSLMDWYYLDEKPIPRKTQPVIRRLRLGSENEADLTTILNEFFVPTSDGWLHGRIEEEIERYRGKADRARINGSKGGRPKKPRKTQPVNSRNPEITGLKANHKPITNNHKLSKRSRFTPPTQKDVEGYITEKGYSVNAIKFISFYESKGWKVGSSKMACWKSAVTGWQTRDSNNTKKTTADMYEGGV